MPSSVRAQKLSSTSTHRLGDIFISHASEDKPFVRRLNKRLNDNGYFTWLDEHKLMPGHSLAKKLSEAIDAAQVVIVVISKHSEQSSWLKYELNLATERMVNGQCRLIPALLGESEPPSEIKGIVYADFRKDFKHGCEGVFRALSEEVSKLISLPNTPMAKSFRQEVGALLGIAFDSISTVTVMRSNSRSHWDCVECEGLPPNDMGEDTWIGYEVVSEPLWPFERHDQNRKLSKGWLIDFKEALEDFPGDYFLIITERLIDLNEKKSYFRDPHIFFIEDCNAELLIIDFSEVKDEKQRLDILKKARAYILRHTHGEFEPR